MNNFVFFTVTFGLPLLGFLVLKDGSGAIYRPATTSELAYQVVDIEEDVAEEEVIPEPEPEAEAAPEEVAEVVAEADTPQDDAQDETAEEAETGTHADEAVETDELPVDADLEEVEVAETDGPEAKSPVADAETAVVSNTSLTDEELAAAERELRKCSSCHQVARDRNGVGPHLVGVFGRPIGAVEGYRYSSALEELNAAGEVWTEENLTAWLEDPAGFATGTKMNFKVRDADARRLIAGWFAANPVE